MPSLVRAQSAWPAQIIKFVVPFAPGGSTDILARVVGQKLEAPLKASILIENRPGAGGSVAANAVAKAVPDGHTFMMGHIGTLAFTPSLYPNLPYDPVKDFAPVALVATVPNILAVHPSVPARSFAEFVAHAKANPGKLSYGSGGIGSAAHVAGAYLASAAGFDGTSAFVGESYDAAALIMLAMEAAGSSASADWTQHVMDVANAPGEPIYPGELAKALELLAAGTDIDYVGATAVELIGPGESAGNYREFEITEGEITTIGFR